MEKWDLYTKDRIRTGQVVERGNSIPDGYYRLVVHVAIFNEDGQMLIQKRKQDKKMWAGLGDINVVGHLIAGENSRQAGEREVKEELGLDISLSDKRPAFSLSFGNGFDDMYTLVQEVEVEQLTLQEDEVDSVRWATEEEIFSMLQDETFIPYHKSVIDMLFFLRNHSEAHTRFP